MANGNYSSWAVGWAGFAGVMLILLALFFASLAGIPPLGGWFAKFNAFKADCVKGIKVDFFHSDKQFMIQRYLGILEDAADHEGIIANPNCSTM